MNNYVFELICARRGRRLRNVESVLGNFVINIGLPNLTVLLPAVVNTFYYIQRINSALSGNGSNVTGIPMLKITPSNVAGSGVGGPIDFVIGPLNLNTTLAEMQRIETDSLTYVVNTHTAGNFVLVCEIFKITMTV